jgi:hypothetical protein
MSRVVFIVVAGFWLTMNVLLWQTEFGSRKSGGAVPLRIVWEKILTAADDSSLTVLHEGKLVGACHMQTQVGEDWSQVSDDNLPSGRPQKGRGYRLRLDGSAVVPELTNRIRFEGELKLNKDRVWQDVIAHVMLRPYTWDVHSVATNQSIHLKAMGGAVPFDLVLKFSDLKNPVALTYKLLGSSSGDLAAEAGLTAAVGNVSELALGVKWDAHEDSLRIGRTPVQVYRLHTRLIDRYEINAIVSRAGEILRVDLPGNYQLVNDRLAASGESTGARPKKAAHKPSSGGPASGSND